MNFKYPLMVIKPENYSFNVMKLLAKVWFIIATLGQWFFGAYVILFYHKSALQNDFVKWNKVLPNGYVEGDIIGNISVATHILISAIIIIGGPLQFIPVIQKFNVFHKWLGRVYTITSMVVAIAGLMMVWVRGAVGDTFMHISLSISAVYILFFAFKTIIHARKKQYKEHQKWALRLYLIANGGWFFRIGLMGWLVLNRAPVGFNPETFSGPFLWVLSALSYSIPISLIILEFYLYAQKKRSSILNYIVALVIFLSILLTLFGTLSAALFNWYPKFFL